MAWIKHASSRNRRKMGELAIKLCRMLHSASFLCAIPVTELASFRLKESSNKKQERKYVLMKTADMMVDLVRTNKHPFRMADMRITKVQHSRYERRQIREFLRLGEWASEA